MAYWKARVLLSVYIGDAMSCDYGRSCRDDYVDGDGGSSATDGRKKNPTGLNASTNGPRKAWALKRPSGTDEDVHSTWASPNCPFTQVRLA